MAINDKLLNILVCPEDKSPLKRADDILLDSLNVRIAAGTLKNRAGVTVTDRLDDGLIRADGRYLYPVRDSIPIMLIDEAIEVTSLNH